MGSLSTVLQPLLTAGQYYVTNSERLRDVKEPDIKNAQMTQNAALQKQSNLLALQQKETDRLNKLRRAVSTQRANFGSQGIGSVTGSADSVLQGLNEASDIERQNNQNKTSLDNKIIDENLKYQTQLNLLQKQQLKQKNALSYATDLIG